jgi:hypothetical protein
MGLGDSLNDKACSAELPNVMTPTGRGIVDRGTASVADLNQLQKRPRIAAFHRNHSRVLPFLEENF